jgi:hypothetical protein
MPMAGMSSACSFLRLLVRLIHSLQSRSFCPSFYNQDELGNLCSGGDVDSGHSRGATMVQTITSGLDNTLGTGSCDDAVKRAATDPDAAASTGDNYRVRIPAIRVPPQAQPLQRDQSTHVTWLVSHNHIPFKYMIDWPEIRNGSSVYAGQDCFSPLSTILSGPRQAN